MSPWAAAGNEKLEFYLKEACSVVSGEQGPEWKVLILDRPPYPCGLSFPICGPGPLQL